MSLERNQPGGKVATDSWTPFERAVLDSLSSLEPGQTAVVSDADGAALLAFDCSYITAATDAELVEIERLVEVPLPALPRHDRAAFSERIEMLGCALARRTLDQRGGRILAETLWRMLGNYPALAIDFMVETGLRTWKWFPSPAECLELLDLWRRNDELARKREEVREALRTERRVRNAHKWEAMQNGTLSQAEIDTLPEPMRRQAVERGLLRHLPDGRFIAAPVEQQARCAQVAELRAAGVAL